MPALNRTIHKPEKKGKKYLNGFGTRRKKDD
jgi:hypothetical protein